MDKNISSQKEEQSQIKNSVPNINEGQQIMNEKSPLYIMDIKMNGKSRQIKIYADSVPAKIAFDFCKDNDLDFTACEQIKQQIIQVLNQHQVETNTNQNTGPNEDLTSTIKTNKTQRSINNNGYNIHNRLNLSGQKGNLKLDTDDQGKDNNNYTQRSTGMNNGPSDNKHFSFNRPSKSVNSLNNYSTSSLQYSSRKRLHNNIKGQMLFYCDYKIKDQKQEKRKAENRERSNSKNAYTATGIITDDPCEKVDNNYNYYTNSHSSHKYNVANYTKNMRNPFQLKSQSLASSKNASSAYYGSRPSNTYYNNNSSNNNIYNHSSIENNNTNLNNQNIDVSREIDQTSSSFRHNFSPNNILNSSKFSHTSRASSTSRRNNIFERLYKDAQIKRITYRRPCHFSKNNPSRYDNSIIYDNNTSIHTLNTMTIGNELPDEYVNSYMIRNIEPIVKFKFQPNSDKYDRFTNTSRMTNTSRSRKSSRSNSKKLEDIIRSGEGNSTIKNKNNNDNNNFNNTNNYRPVNYEKGNLNEINDNNNYNSNEGKDEQTGTITVYNNTLTASGQKPINNNNNNINNNQEIPKENNQGNSGIQINSYKYNNTNNSTPNKMSLNSNRINQNSFNKNFNPNNNSLSNKGNYNIYQSNVSPSKHIIYKRDGENDGIYIPLRERLQNSYKKSDNRPPIQPQLYDYSNINNLSPNNNLVRNRNSLFLNLFFGLTNGRTELNNESLTLEKIPEDIQTVIKPIVNQIKNNNASYYQDTFISTMNDILNILNLEDKIQSSGNTNKNNNNIENMNNTINTSRTITTLNLLNTLGNNSIGNTKNNNTMGNIYSNQNDIDGGYTYDANKNDITNITINKGNKDGKLYRYGSKKNGINNSSFSSRSLKSNSRSKERYRNKNGSKKNFYYVFS